MIEVVKIGNSAGEDSVCNRFSLLPFFFSFFLSLSFFVSSVLSLFPLSFFPFPSIFFFIFFSLFLIFFFLI